MTKTRQLFSISYTLAPETYFVKSCNNILWHKNVSFREITVMCDKKYLNSDISKYIAIQRCSEISK